MSSDWSTNMKSVYLAVMIAVFSPAHAFAEGPTQLQVEQNVSTIDPVPIALDWSGFYAGVTAGRLVNGFTTYFYRGVSGDYYDMSGNGAGLFAGYNVQRDSLVYGFELAAQSANYVANSNFFAPEFTSMLDLQLRGGWSVEHALPYAFVGYSRGNWENDNELTNPSGTGMNYGVGIDFALANHWLAGVKYIQRDMSTAFNENDNGVEPEFGTLQLRLGYSF
ncbi:opacity protein-like surface antigen [Loktanella sp. PT4BL]|nr:opacity protein-like surface antigen [Loktanella sp. PT4BL]